MPWEVNKADGSPDEPNDQNGDEECVRMRGGFMNDAQCTKQFTGTMRENLGMGYVCERHANLVPTTPPQVTTDSANYSTCEENDWGIEPFKVRSIRRVLKVGNGLNQNACLQTNVIVKLIWPNGFLGSARLRFTSLL